jgi:hypothetical protein
MSSSELVGGLALLALAIPAPANPAGPVPITVPAGLQDGSATLEPSGLVWAGPIERYLVVSDDTGPADDHHQPWLLAMSRDGILDEAPVPIQGIARINDGESICAGPEGTFFFSTSHSENRRGKSGAARRMLLLLGLDGRELHVLGRVDLRTARDGRGGSLLDIAGLSADGRLDVEALAYRDGALLIGLKSPLTTGGEAVILRLENPAQTLRDGEIPAGAVTRLAAVALRDPGRNIARGISDMTVLPDGSLIIVANSPKGMPSDGGGAIFRLGKGPNKGASKGPNADKAVLLRSFPNLKPEGVTMAADRRALVLVFDNGRKPPLWMRWPLEPGAVR